MLKKMKRWLAMALCLCLVLAGCAKKEESSLPNTPKTGRYLQETLALPEGTTSILDLETAPDGTVELYVSDGKQAKAYRVGDGGTWTALEKPWLDSFSADGNASIADISIAPDGVPYVITTDYSAYETTNQVICKIYRITDASPVEVPFQPPADFKGHIRQLLTLASGDYLITQGYGPLLQFSGEDGTQRYAYGDSSFDAAVMADGRLAVVDQVHGDIKFYDTATGEEQEGTALPNFQFVVERGPIAAVRDGALAICSAAGIQTADAQGSQWEMPVRGDMVSLSAPTLLFQKMAMLDNGDFLVAAADAAKEYAPCLLRYYFSQEASAAPSKIMRICSMRDSQLIRGAIAQMQNADSDLYIQLETMLDTDGGGTLSDAVKTINTELLAGKGADVYVLDDMPVESYIEKGVLEDLSGVLQTGLDAGDYQKNVVNTYARDGKVFAVPARYAVPLIAGPSDLIAASPTFSALADWAVSHTPPPLLSTMNSKNILERTFVICSPTWLSGKGILDMAGFSAYLEDVKRIAETAPESVYAPLRSLENVTWGDMLSYSVGLTGMALCYTNDINTVNAARFVFEDKGSFDFAGLNTRDGAGGVYEPLLLLGINRSSAVKDTAGVFIETMLSDEVQKIRMNDTEGLPVNVKTIQNKIDAARDDPNSFGTMIGGTPNGEMVTINVTGWLNEAQEKKLTELLNRVDTPSVTDSVLYEMILEETSGYFDGAKTLEDTVASVVERTQAYLAE